jgi:type I restriction enzyme, S subunit
MKASGKIPKDDNWKKKYQEPQSVTNIDSLPDIPDSWIWVNLDTICEKITDGEHLTPPTTEEGIYLLSAKDVRDGYLDFSDTKFISSEIAENQEIDVIPKKNDILVVSRGATVGRTCLITTDETFCLMGSVLLFKIYKNVINPKIVDFFFKSPLGTKKLISMSGASAQQAIYIRDMRSFIVVIPPLEEQKEIVRKIEKLFEFADRIEEQIKYGIERIETLNQSILAKAFRGELVEQDPKDEPASVLLERIKTLKETKTTVKTTKPKKQN